jgi:hypothetical protein
LWQIVCFLECMRINLVPSVKKKYKKQKQVKPKEPNLSFRSVGKLITAINNLERNNSLVDCREALQTLLVYIHNIHRNPQDIKYRRINKSNVFPFNKLFFYVWAKLFCFVSFFFFHQLYFVRICFKEAIRQHDHLEIREQAIWFQKFFGALFVKRVWAFFWIQKRATRNVSQILPSENKIVVFFFSQVFCKFFELVLLSTAFAAQSVKSAKI